MKPKARILDMGAHDGFVTTWIARQLKDEVDLEVSGIELHPEAVEIARRRFAEEGVLGKVVQDDALNAPKHFAEHSFDCVAALELIEHVPDPQALLDVCERMVKPGGYVYVSTPDGTCGFGCNPHHLRVLRSQDLFDMMRKRGRVLDLQVDLRDPLSKVMVGAYTPAPRRGEIAIYAGPGWGKWSPMDPETKGLGGSETAIVRVAQALSQIGYVVTVYGSVEQCVREDVIFRDWTTFDPTVHRHAVISVRQLSLFDRPIAATVRALWLHDTQQDPITEARAERIDHVLTLSKWHQRHVGAMYPWLRPKIRRIRNGIVPEFFNGSEPPEREQRVLYTSSPDRGLDILLELWPDVRKQVPDAVLEHAYADVYDKIADAVPAIAEFRAHVAELSKQPGVERLGHLTQPELAQKMRASLVWAHPSWATLENAPFYETSCIGAAEAQAAGCLVVASDWGALPETVRAGRLVNSDPPGPRWRKAIVREIVDGLTNPETQAWAQDKGPKAAKRLGWSGVGEQIAKLIEGEV